MLFRSVVVFVFWGVGTNLGPGGGRVATVDGQEISAAAFSKTAGSITRKSTRRSRGCIGFMILKYHWGRLGKSQMFKCFPFVIVAINILIAVVSDFESAVHFFMRDYFMLNGSPVWVTSEHATQVCGWNNVFNEIGRAHV